jgi:hypothetical protein
MSTIGSLLHCGNVYRQLLHRHDRHAGHEDYNWL